MARRKKLLHGQFADKGVVETEESGRWGSFSRFLPEGRQKWEVITEYWAYQGLKARNKKAGELLRIAFDTPFIVSWQARHATMLTESLVVYQLGDQIVLLDLDKRKIGLITSGRGPIVKRD